MKRGIGIRFPDRRSVEQRRAERELFFWTARQWVYLILLTAAAAYSIVSMANGDTPWLDLLQVL